MLWNVRDDGVTRLRVGARLPAHAWAPSAGVDDASDAVSVAELAGLAGLAGLVGLVGLAELAELVGPD